MKILLVSNMFPSAEDRVYGVFVKNFIENMKRSGAEFCDICVIKGKRKGKLFKITAYIRLYVSVLLKALFRNYDIMYVHYPLHTAPLIRLIRMFSARPLVLNFHGSDLFISEKVNRFIKNQSEKLATEAEMVVVPSRVFKNGIIEKLNVHESKIIVSPSGGVNFGIFNRNELDSPEKREFSAGYISRIDKGKGWEVFIKAVALLKNTGELKGKRFLLLGSGKQDDLKEKMIEENNLIENVFVSRSVPQHELARYYRSLELFVFPSERESLGLVGLEAMACGVPVLGADNDGISSYIDNGENGLLFKKGDAQDLAEKISDFFKMSKVKRMEMEEKAYETASNYEDSRIATELLINLRKRFFPGELNGKI